MPTILIVDDRPSNRQFLTTLLGYGGHRMLEAEDGARALDAVRAERPALVITDILMPNMDGYEFVQRMRADPELMATPVIFYTATYSTPQAEALARSCGVRKVLSKPSEPHVILAAVNEALGIANQGEAAPLAVGSRPSTTRSPDNTMSLLLKDLAEVKERFQDLAARSVKTSARRDPVKELSRRFSENVESMQRVATRLSALLEVGMELATERNPRRLVELFFAAACDLVESKYAAVGMLDEGERAIDVAFARGFDAGILRGDAARSGLLGSLLSGKSVMQKGADALGPDELPASHPRVRNLLGVPVASVDRVYGWMYFADARTVKGFSDEDMRVATAMTRKLALLYENAMLYDEIQRHAAQLQIEVSERRRAEAALQRFRLAMDNSGDMILISDQATLRHVDVNQTACRLLGYSREELLQIGPPEILPVSREELEKTYDELIADPSRASGMRSYYLCKDGSQLPFESTRRVLRSGDTWLIVAISRDIRGRLAAEQALRESERGLQRAQVMAKLGHVITGPDGAFESWSETLPQLAGIAPATMPRSTREWLERVHPEDRERFRASSIEAAATGQRTQIEYRLQRADDDWIDIRQFIEPLPAQAGAKERNRWFSTLQDVTEQKRAEEELRAGRQLLDNIVDNIPTSVQLKSVPDFRVLLWNKAAEAMYGVPRGEAIGRNVHDLWPQEDADRFHAADLELIASGHLQDFPDRPAQTRARGEIRVHMRKVALFDAAGKATHVLAIADDITNRLADQARLRESEERFRSLSMLSSDWFWEQDEQHRFVKFSGGEGVKGWGPDQSKAVGLHRWDLGGVIPMSCSWEEHKGLLDAHKPFRNFEYRRILDDGRLQYVEASGEPIFDAAGRFTGYRGVATEITQRKAAEAKIKRLNRVYAVLSGINTLIVRARRRDELFNEACRIAVKDGQFRMAWIGLVDHDSKRLRPVASDGDVRGFFDSSPVATMPKRKAKGKGLSWQAVTEKRPVIANDVQADPQTSMKDECRERGINSLVMLPLVVGGDAIGVLALYAAETGFFDDEEMRLLVELAGDISFALDHLQKAEKLNYLAYYDELTGLANRTLFHERLSQHVSAAGAGKAHVAVVILDIERFKSINDALGRQMGDALLKQIAGRMRQHSDDPARLARISADHFAVVVPGVQSEEEFARRAEQRMHQYFDEPFRLGDSELRVAARAGVAMYPDDGADAETLFRNAEAALKKAKTSGDKILFYTQQMTERVAGKLALENKLRLALEREEFVLHYQPKVNLETGKIAGVEALIRWQTPDKGLVPPGQFIPLLEETGLILQVGSWALKRASLDHRGWVEQGLKPPRVAVNVSAIQLRQRDFVEVVEQAIIEGVAPTGIDLEITESLVMEDIKGNIEKLKAVCALGVNIAIDDFGTGYSSLGYLAKLPVQFLKIDRSFIIAMHNDPNAMTLVSMIISLAHSLRLKVVAEGVETEEQAKFLRLLRCDEMQGYLFSKPVPAEALVELLRKNVP